MTDNDPAANAAGIYPDVPELDYHSGRFGPHGSVSSTEAKRLLNCPALYKWSKEHPAPPKSAFDFGHTVRGMVLGTGLGIYVHDHDSLCILASLRRRHHRNHPTRLVRHPGRLTDWKGPPP